MSRVTDNYIKMCERMNDCKTCKYKNNEECDIHYGLDFGLDNLVKELKKIDDNEFASFTLCCIEELVEKVKRYGRK